MTIDELAKLKANSIPNSTLVKYYEAGIPQWHIEAILTMLKSKKLSVLQEFILKFISSGIDDISDICKFLGVNRTAINNAVAVLQKNSLITVDIFYSKLKLTDKGEKDLKEAATIIPEDIEYALYVDGLLGNVYQNMEIQRIQRGIPDKAVIQKTLDMVGLKDTRKKAVRNFSLGMRQRLGIAIALLNTPEFLILDEPINGLDPAGIVEIRNLLKSLNKEYGMTILVSSHILEELYQTASEFILIDKGKIIEEISDRELNDRCKRHIAIKATDPQKALIVLEETLHTDSFKLMPDGMIRLYDYLDDMEKVAAALSDAHILVTGLSVAGDTLEDYFLSKIGGTGNVKSPKS